MLIANSLRHPAPQHIHPIYITGGREVHQPATRDTIIQYNIHMLDGDLDSHPSSTEKCISDLVLFEKCYVTEILPLNDKMKC